MFVYNRCTTDARVLKTADAARRAGHVVEVVAVLDRTTQPFERHDGFTISRINRDPVHYKILRVARSWRRRMFLVVQPQRLRSRIRRLIALLTPVRFRQHIVVRRLRWYRRRIRETVRGGPMPPAQPGAAARASAIPVPTPGRSGDSGVRAPGKVEEWLKRRDERLSPGLYRAVMFFHRPLLFVDWYWRALRHVIARGGADVYHAHDLLTLPVAVIAARRTGGRVVYDAHELYPEVSTLSARERRVWTRIESRLIGRADAVVTVCDSIATELSQRYGIAKPIVVLNAPQGRGADRNRDKSPIRSVLELTDDAVPLVLYQGGFAHHRGLETLIRAARQLDDVMVVLQGWGHLEEELRQLVRDSRLTGRVVFVGPVHQQDVIAFAAGADLGVIPYEPVGLNNRYTTPNKLFDYMTARLPIVASRLPELERFVDRGGIGRTFAPGDPDDLAEAIQGLLADNETRAAMRLRAGELAQEFTWERESEKLLRCYEANGYVVA